jgi:hypothetical protein
MTVQLIELSHLLPSKEVVRIHTSWAIKRFSTTLSKMPAEMNECVVFYFRHYSNSLKPRKKMLQTKQEKAVINKKMNEFKLSNNPNKPCCQIAT